MNIPSERAREACESCRRSHKKCKYDDNSTRCLRCEKRNTTCSLFLSVETTTSVAEQGPSTLTAVGSAADSWAGTPQCSAPSNLSYQFPSQEDCYWSLAAFTGDTQSDYPADMVFQGFANQQEQPTTNQGGLYGHNMFGDHSSA